MRLLLAGALLGAIGWIACTPTAPPHPLGRPLTFLTRLDYDLQSALVAVQPPRQKVIVVGFDSQTEATLGQLWPPSRAVMAQAIQKIQADGAKVIGLDVLPERATTRDADIQLASAIRRSGRVVLGARMDRDPDALVARKALISPYSSDDGEIDFEEGATLGLTEVPTDDDGITRRVMLGAQVVGEHFDSFAVAAYRLAGGQEIPVGELDGLDPIDGSPILSARPFFRGGSSVVETGPDLAQVAAGNFAPGTFKDRIAFIGITGTQLAKELGDLQVNARTSLRPELSGGALRRTMPGVVLQAHACQALLNRDWVRVVSIPLQLCLTWLLGLAGWWWARWINPWKFACLLAGLASVLVGAHAAFVAGFFVPSLVPVLSGIFVASATAIGDRAKLRKLWSRHVSPAVMHTLLKNEGTDPFTQRCVATVLFSDIRGFTAYSADLDPEVVVTELNKYFDIAVPIIMRHGGTVDKFMGDGLLAVFGAPLPLQNAAQSAADAAREVTRETRSTPFQTGVGLATGEVVAGHVGGQDRHDFTVIGAVVNLASRIQGQSGAGEVLLDEATARQIESPVTEKGIYTLKGFPEPIRCLILADPD